MAKTRMKMKFKRISGATIAFAAVFLLFLFYSFTVLFATGWAFSQSLKSSREFFRDMFGLPQKWLFSNWAKAFDKLSWSKTNFFGMFFNSVWFAVGSSALSVFMHCVTGYIFAKYRFRGKEVAFSFILFTLIIPIVGNLPSMYKIVFNLKLNDSPLFLTTFLGGFGTNFLITYAYFRGIDWAYAEAAQIDGAGHVYIFFRIMLPLALAPVTALLIIGVIGNWNNYETPILFLSKMPTQASGLYYFKEIYIAGNEPLYFAGVLMTALPVIALAGGFGKLMMKNMTMGGIKG